MARLKARRLKARRLKAKALSRNAALLLTDSSVSSSVSDEYFNYLMGWMTFTATLVYTIQVFPGPS